jgi:hypothetical protein
MQQILLDPYFLSSPLESKFDWVTGVYGTIVGWDNFSRYSEYVQIV